MADKPVVTSKMDKLVALCRRRGFIFQSSEIYGGINGFWDYGPLGVELKRNLKDAWWQDIVRCPPVGPHGHPIDMVGLDCTIIMNRRVWEASGHATGFNDPMVDDRETKQRFRADQLFGLFVLPANEPDEAKAAAALQQAIADGLAPVLTVVAASAGEATEYLHSQGKKLLKEAGAPYKNPAEWQTHLRMTDGRSNEEHWATIAAVPGALLKSSAALVPSPFTQKKGSLTEPRQFNLMFQTFVGAVQNDDSMAYLRPETAQGIFANFRNVTDTSRVKVPFGIAQIGKAFRNEVTPRNFTFRSREFEQMEIEFFIHPKTAVEWYQFWRDTRFKWWQSIGLAGSNLQLREHDRDELAHYAKEGAGTSDIEYKFPFTDPGFGELEGVAHRTDFDLRQHAQFSGLGDKLKYYDQEANERYFPHVIEPSAGADRGTLALLCEAYTEDPGRPSGVVMKFHPRMAPIKAGIFPLVDKEGMPEIATNLYHDLRKTWNVQLDIKQNIGKRYARMDEAGTPFCFTIDTQTLSDQTVTVRYRDTLQQERVALGQVRHFLSEKMAI
ncbi:MAG: glycine--tRNA ligase [Phycisphaerales bacterium]|nr:glycine--tRNA ligase [Phycisphaerales bacterium]